MPSMPFFYLQSGPSSITNFIFSQEKIVWNFPIIVVLMCHQDLRNLKTPTNQTGIQKGFFFNITTDQDIFETMQESTFRMNLLSLTGTCLLSHPYFWLLHLVSCSPANWRDTTATNNFYSLKHPCPPKRTNLQQASHSLMCFLQVPWASHFNLSGSVSFSENWRDGLRLF